jgi:hypothetical protein
MNTGIVLTTSGACKGADFVFAVPQAYVIHTALPATWLQLQQDSGRGVRGHQELPVIGAIFTSEPYNTVDQVKRGLTFAERFEKLFTSDYALAHSFLVACAESNAATHVKTFETAVDMLNMGKPAAEIYKILSSVKRFKKFLPKEAPKPAFAVPASKKVGDKFGALGKRTPPKQQYEEKKESPIKRQATSHATIIYSCQHLDCKRTSSFFTVCCELCRTKTKDAW